MQQDEIIQIIRDYMKVYEKQYGILEIGVFGSVARNEAVEGSDVDVVVHVSRPDLFLLAGLKYDLEDRLERPVDVVAYREDMNPFLKKMIDREAIYA